MQNYSCHSGGTSNPIVYRKDILPDEHGVGSYYLRCWLNCVELFVLLVILIDGGKKVIHQNYSVRARSEIVWLKRTEEPARFLKSLTLLVKTETCLSAAVDLFHAGCQQAGSYCSAFVLKLIRLPRKVFAYCAA